MKRSATILATCLLPWVATCGGDGGEPVGMRPLTPDPAVVSGCTPGGVGVGTVRAKVIGCADELIPGTLAAGRVGDLIIENAAVRFVIRGPGNGYYLHGTAGGGVIDGAPVGGIDEIKEIQPLVEMNVGEYDELVITEAGDDGPAEIVARGPAAVVPLVNAALPSTPQPLTVEHHWILAADEPRLLMKTIIWGQAGGFYQVADAIFVGGAETPFLPQRGFLDGGTASGRFLAFAGPGESYGIGYGPEVDGVQLVDIGGVRILFGPTFQPNDPTGVSRWLLVGDGSVESITRQAWELRGELAGGSISGSFPGPDGVEQSVVVTDTGGNALTVARPDATGGAFQALLPPGNYLVHTESPARAPGTPVPVTVAAADVPVSPTAEPWGGASVTTNVPARVTVWSGGDRLGVWFTRPPDFTAAVPLPPGSYRLSVSRGLEYDAVTVDPLVIAPDTVTPVPATLDRVVDTAGWISADTHLHSEMSSDSTFPLQGRLSAVAAEGVELAISTDHDFLTDYTPVLEQLQLEPWLAGTVGEESSSIVIGHMNSWPMTIDRDVPAQGAIPWFDRAPGEVIGLLRAQGNADPDRVVQVNHPRNPGMGLYALIDFRPDTLTAGRDPEDLGFPPGTNLVDMDYDALEVCNDRLDEVFVDWLALLAGGHAVTATGSSDSHGATAFAGKCRTYTWVGPGNDDPATVDVRAVNQAIRDHHVVVGTGAFVTATLEDPAAPGTLAMIGDVMTVTGASATLHVKVQAPPWMATGMITVYQGKDAAATIPLDPADTAVVRHDAPLDLPLDGTDTFFVVRVDLAGPGDPVYSGVDASFTNPIFVDGDGDGVWNP